MRIVESEGRPGVAMLAVCEGKVALVHVYRYPVTSWEWAIPRGYAHYDDASRSARTELTEELGQEPNELASIGTVTPNSGVLASHVELFVAYYSTIPSGQADHYEVTNVKWINIRTLYNEIARGQIKDAFTLSAIACAQAHGLMAGLADNA